MKSFLNRLIPLDSSLRVAYHRLRGITAALLSGEPSRDMIVIGITGTKGKTTASCLVTHGLVRSGKRVALLSTSQMYLPDRGWYLNELKMSSPDPFVIQKFLTEARSQKCEYVVLETTSHALFYDRVHGVHYDVAALTNISQDHLDLHHTMEAYVDIKLKLFKSLVYAFRKGETRKVSVINIDAEYAGRFLAETADIIMTYGLSPGAQVRAQDITFDRHGTAFTLKMPSQSLTIQTKLFGEFNVLNTLCAIAILVSQRIAVDKLPEIFSDFTGVPGRLEYLPNNHGLSLYIDYAHTEDSLRVVLSTLRALEGTQRIIALFGATGDRDREKRPKMGMVAHELADVVILTDDDTYSEDSWQILKEVMSWVPRQEGQNFWVIPSREDAIRTAILMAQPWDAVILAGKGAEMVMVTNAGSIPWSDKAVVRKVLDEIEANTIPDIFSQA